MRVVVCVVLCLVAVGPLWAEGGRRMVDVAEQAGWTAVGRLHVTGQGFCTAALIAPDLVVTAAHCLADRRRGGVVAPERVHFLAGFRTGRFAAHGTAGALAIAPGFRSDARAGTVAADLAVVALAAPMPAAVVPLAVAPAAAPWGAAATLVSYGVDRAQLLSVQTACAVTARRGGLLVTDCDGVPGTSGAPLLQEVAGGWAVSGVASAVLRAGAAGLPRGKVLAAAADRTRIDALIRAARADAPLERAATLPK